MFAYTAKNLEFEENKCAGFEKLYEDCFTFVQESLQDLDLSPRHAADLAQKSFARLFRQWEAVPERERRLFLVLTARRLALESLSDALTWFLFSSAPVSSPAPVRAEQEVLVNYQQSA